MASSSRSGCASPALNRKSSVATSRRRTSSEPSRGAAVARTLAPDPIGAGSSGAKVLKIARRRTTSRCVAANGSAIGPPQSWTTSVASRSWSELSSCCLRSTCRGIRDRKSTRLNSSHLVISYAVFCLKKKKYYIDNATFLNPTQAYVFFHTKTSSLTFYKQQERRML